MELYIIAMSKTQSLVKWSLHCCRYYYKRQAFTGLRLLVPMRYVYLSSRR